MKYNNPVPVSVCLAPIECELRFESTLYKFCQLLYVRRGIDPKKGCWALPGGYVNEMETAEQAASRELKEETGVNVTSNAWKLEVTDITESNRLLLFMSSPCLASSEIVDWSQKTSETIEMAPRTSGGHQAAFDLHERRAKAFLDRENGRWIEAYTKHMSATRLGAFIARCLEAQVVSEEWLEQFRLRNAIVN
jgi:ADP-ribose pyrophosphatase YjhB (NUDIX family)